MPFYENQYTGPMIIDTTDIDFFALEQHTYFFGFLVCCALRESRKLSVFSKFNIPTAYYSILSFEVHRESLLKGVPNLKLAQPELLNIFTKVACSVDSMVARGGFRGGGGTCLPQFILRFHY